MNIVSKKALLGVSFFTMITGQMKELQVKMRKVRKTIEYNIGVTPKLCKDSLRSSQELLVPQDKIITMLEVIDEAVLAYLGSEFVCKKRVLSECARFGKSEYYRIAFQAEKK